MKKLNQKGFLEPIQILLIVLILGVVGYVGYRYTQNKEEEPVAQQETAKPEEQAPVETPAENKVEIVTLDEEITLTSPGDLEKLPDTVPASFVDHMEVVLNANVADESGCVMMYSVNIVSPLNISGGTGSVDATTLESGTGSCIGGARTVWYLKDGKWDDMGFQAQPGCDELEKTTIYSEFMELCYDASAEVPDQTPNPNGSIQDANKEQ